MAMHTATSSTTRGLKGRQKGLFGFATWAALGAVSICATSLAYGLSPSRFEKVGKGQSKTPQVLRAGVTAPDDLEKKPPLRLNSPSPAQASNPCERVYKGVVSYYQTLELKLPKPIPKGSPLQEFLAIKGADCAGPLSAETSLAIMEAGLSQNSGKIGVLLPLSGTDQIRANRILAGLKAAVASADPKRELIVVDSQGHITEFLKGLAELVLVHNVALIIGGITSDEAKSLSYWGEHLMIPTLLLSPYSQAITNTRTSFQVFPSEASQAQLLATYAKARAFQKLAILRPNRRSNAQLPRLLREQLSQRNIAISQELLYVPEIQSSIEASVRALLHIDDPQRSKEREELFKAKKAEAELNKLTFNPRMIQLPPQLDCDALIILDNFRMLRHIINTLRYFGLTKIPLLGHQEWRSAGLITPEEPLLDGAVFVDVVGNLTDLEPGILQDEPNGNFASARDMATLDYRLIAYRAVAIALAVTKAPLSPRRKLAAQIRELKLPPTKSFPAGAVFDDSYQSFWPSYLFRVQSKGLSMIQVTTP